jgi:Cu(I)/Ag(I) efflux system membrane fusion protein
MKTFRLLLACGLLLLARIALAAEPAEADTFLAHYEQIRAALADDNLAAAQAAAKTLPEAKTVATSASISDARKAFKALSAQAVARARGRPGFFIAHCSMFPGGADWVQTTEQLSNPYWGKSMPHCGELVK